MTKDPEALIITELNQQIAEITNKLKLKGSAKIQEITKKDSFGDFCTPIFQLAKINKKNPMELSKEIVDKFPSLDIIEEVSADGGFVNIKLNREYWSQKLLGILLEDKKFYRSESYNGKNIIVEHTSANPNGPIHIGNFRGSIIGDTFARLLKTVGANVKTHFYVDDLGHQVPVMVIGYELLKKYKKKIPKKKLDHYLGQVYAITHTMYDIQKLKLELQEEFDIKLGQNQYWIENSEIKMLDTSEIKKKIAESKISEYKKELNFIFTVQQNIFERLPKLYGELKECIESEAINLPKAVPDLNRRYIEQEKEAVKAVRTTCEDVLKGQKQELALFDIKHDHFDWEADLQWSGKVDDVLAKLDKNGFIIKEGKARVFDANKAADAEAREYLKLKKNYEVPNGLLVTSSGDTLYLLRDIPYSLDKVDKFNADIVYNVIGKPQELTRKQLNLALRALGRSDVANKMVHLNYEYMELKGALTRMSARRLQYITPSELLKQTKKAVMDSFLKERDYPEKEKKDIADTVAIGAIKYSIIAVGLMRKMIFNPQDVVSLNSNTSTFIQYAYARSQNILAKTKFKWSKSKLKSLKKLTEDEEWKLLLLLVKLPRIILTAATQIKPELICNYLYDVATLFNKFYDNHRVLDAGSEELVTARLALTYTTGLILLTGLELLGIKSPKRM